MIFKRSTRECFYLVLAAGIGLFGTRWEVRFFFWTITVLFALHVILDVANWHIERKLESLYGIKK